MLQFLDFIISLADAKKLSIDADTYLLECLTKQSVEKFSKPFGMML